MKTAGAPSGTSVAVFGLGGVGLSAVMGARLAGCHPIVAVDVLDAKLALARRLGATEAVNAATDDPVAPVRELTAGGAQYAFEAVGNAKVLAQAYAATRRGGTTVAIGLPHPEQLLQVSALSLVVGERTLRGSYMGSAVPRRDVTRLIDLYRAGKLPVDELHSGSFALSEVNAGFDALAAGDVVRQVLTFES